MVEPCSKYVGAKKRRFSRLSQGESEIGLINFGDFTLFCRRRLRNVQG